jgi:fermentation-respiration switch protein FrsA (DUF1100 family)
VLRFLLGILAAMLIVVAVIWLLQRRMIYFPAAGVPPVEERLPGWEEAAFETADGLTLHGWFSPPPNDSPVVVVFNGNAGNREHRATLGSGLASKRFGVLLLDYRGYGDNPGHPTAGGLALDARAAVDWVRRRAPNHDVVYFGESLGAAVAIELAVSDPPDALILRSPFTSLADMADVHFPLPVRWLLRDRYPSIDQIGKVGAPTLVIAGTDDSIVPIDQSRAIYEAAPSPKELVVVQGADHNDFALTVGPEVIEPTVRFIAEVGSG